MSKSAKNSFKALRFSDDDAVVESLRTDLADIIRKYIEQSSIGSSQTAIGKRLGIPQSTISAIKNDHIDRISIEYFIRLLTRASISWTARSWHGANDAAWVAGGIYQLLAATEPGKKQVVTNKEVWEKVLKGNFIPYFWLGSGAPKKESSVVPPSHSGDDQSQKEQA